VSLCSHLEDEHSCESKVTVRISLDTPSDLFVFLFSPKKEMSFIAYGLQQLAVSLFGSCWWVTIFVGKVMYALFLIHRRVDICCLSFEGFVFIDVLQKVFFFS
jgi:hypothetical protein